MDFITFAQKVLLNYLVQQACQKYYLFKVKHHQRVLMIIKVCYQKCYFEFKVQPIIGFNLKYFEINFECFEVLRTNLSVLCYLKQGLKTARPYQKIVRDLRIKHLLMETFKQIILQKVLTKDQVDEEGKYQCPFDFQELVFLQLAFKLKKTSQELKELSIELDQINQQILLKGVTKEKFLIFDPILRKDCLAIFKLIKD